MLRDQLCTHTYTQTQQHTTPLFYQMESKIQQHSTTSGSNSPPIVFHCRKNPHTFTQSQHFSGALSELNSARMSLLTKMLSDIRDLHGIPLILRNWDQACSWSQIRSKIPSDQVGSHFTAAGLRSVISTQLDLNGLESTRHRVFGVRTRTVKPLFRLRSFRNIKERFLQVLSI